MLSYVSFQLIANIFRKTRQNICFLGLTGQKFVYRLPFPVSIFLLHYHINYSQLSEDHWFPRNSTDSQLTNRNPRDNCSPTEHCGFLVLILDPSSSNVTHSGLSWHTSVHHWMCYSCFSDQDCRVHSKPGTVRMCSHRGEKCHSEVKMPVNIKTKNTSSPFYF